MTLPSRFTGLLALSSLPAVSVTLTAATSASTLTTVTAPAAALTAADKRTGGPG